MLGASLAVHAVFTPLPALLGLLALLPLGASDLPPEEALDAIPVDLFEDAPPDPEPPAPPPPPAQAARALLAPEDPKEPSAPKPTAPAEAPKDAPNGGEKTEEEPSARDPLAMEGSVVGKLAGSNANVRLVIHTAPIGEHPDGARIAELLRRTPQWADFFGPAEIDPILDVDRVEITGTELRSSKNIAAVVQHHVSKGRIDAALEALVSRAGSWVDKDARLVRIEADGAERVLRAPNDHIVAVAPPSAERSVRKLPKNARLPSGAPGVAVDAFVKKPAETLRGLRVKLPASLASAAAEVRATATGGVEILLHVEDSEPELASEHARELETLVRKATEVDFSRMGAFGALAAFAFGGSKTKLVETVTFEEQGKGRIEGRLVLTRKQLATLLDLLDGFLPPEPPRPAARGVSDDGASDDATPPPAAAEPSADAPSVTPAEAEPEGAPPAPGSEPLLPVAPEGEPGR